MFDACVNFQCHVRCCYQLLCFDNNELILGLILFHHMGVSKNSGKTPQIIHLFIGFSIIFTIHFGGNTTPIFGNTHPYIYIYVYVEWPRCFNFISPKNPCPDVYSPGMHPWAAHRQIFLGTNRGTMVLWRIFKGIPWVVPPPSNGGNEGL